MADEQAHRAGEEDLDEQDLERLTAALADEDIEGVAAAGEAVCPLVDDATRYETGHI